jgi:hypothetical protein
MTSATGTKPRIRSSAPRHARSGVSTLDALVAFVLLTTTISVAAPLVVRHGRLMKSQRDYRLALDELSNQMDRLTALPAAQLPAAIQQLEPSTFLAERVPGGQLTGELQPAEVGTRLVLKISWKDSHSARAPVSLAAWIIPPPQPSRTPDGNQP